MSERVQEQRQVFEQEVLAKVAPQDVLVLDETGLNLAMTPSYGYARSGQRAVGLKPCTRGKNQTCLAALSLEGVVAPVQYDGALNGERFLDWVENHLGPHLRPGHVVVMDNLRVHKVEGVQALIEARGARVEYLPPYSPDFSPIEPLWAWMKSFLRRFKLRRPLSLQPATRAIYKALPREFIARWFRHCGWIAEHTSSGG